jgi:hypothetical protein
MGVEAIIATLIGVAGVTGGYFGGKRSGKSQNLSDDVNAVTILQAAVAELKDQNRAKDSIIVALNARVNALENLVTQKADVAAVEAEVRGVREVVDRIAEVVHA